MGAGEEDDEEPGNQLEWVPGAAPPTLAGVDHHLWLSRVRFLAGGLHQLRNLVLYGHLSDSNSVGGGGGGVISKNYKLRWKII